ncbi:MAG: sulfotransferase [Bacteroidota bacterium]
MTPVFFITGLQRSGTTLLSFMLSNHPAVFLDEYSLGFRIIQALKTNYSRVLPKHLDLTEEEIISQLVEHDYKGRLRQLIDVTKLEEVDSVRALITRSIQQKLQKEGRSYWGDKSPGLQHWLPELLLLMPQAKLIHIVRDGRATAASMRKRARKHLMWSAQRWVDGNLTALQHQYILGKEQMLVIRYEDLLTDPEGSMGRICTFLDLDFDPLVLDLSQHQRTGGDQSYVQDRLSSSKIDSYRKELSVNEIRQLERIQGPLLQKLGYELENAFRAKDFCSLSTGRRIWLNQWTNFKALFRRKDIRMENWQLVEVSIPFRKRLGYFLRMLARDVLSKQIFLTLFDRKTQQLPR